MTNPMLTFDHKALDAFSTTEKQKAITALENGSVIFLPHISFDVQAEEHFIFTPSIINKKAKNISYFLPKHQLKGAQGSSVQLLGLQQFMHRFANYTKNLVEHLFFPYTQAIIVGRTSFRPIEIETRQASYKKDDTRLHVDSFVATPVHGLRLLRIFCNIHPQGIARVWQIGESFEQVAKKFLPLTSPYSPVAAKWLARLKITKSTRSAYDHLMLQLHDKMKKDMDYQTQLEKFTMPFPAHSTWIVFSDQVSHAALSGCYLLEQTFYLPVFAMQDPAQSPLKVLERMTNTTLISTEETAS